MVLSVSEWDVNAVRYMTPKVNDKGGKSINVISNQTNRTLNISTPLMMTWGVSDFVDEKGEQDGKFMISLVFPNDDYITPATTNLLGKIKSFEDKFLDDAVKNSESWFGESMSREIVKHMFFPILKYPKNKETKKFDYSRPPTIKAKVPLYNGKWGVEIFDTNSKLIFPNEDPNMTPMDFIPKSSLVACVVAFSQIWIGGKGMGIQMKLVQCIVKPRETVSVVGKCQICLTDEEMELIASPNESEVIISNNSCSNVTTDVCDSDDDEPIEKPIEKPVMIKKVVKKIAVVEPTVETIVEPTVETIVKPAVETVMKAKPNVIKKKIVKK